MPSVSMKFDDEFFIGLCENYLHYYWPMELTVNGVYLKLMLLQQCLQEF